MPELPDLIYIEKYLRGTLPGKKITAVEIKEPIVLRVFIADRFDSALRNATFESVYRHGPFLGFKLNRGLEVVLHPMLAGRLQHLPAAQKPGKNRCFSLRLDDDSALHYLDDKKMGKIYLTNRGEYTAIPRYLQQGVNVLSEDFTPEHFKHLLARQRKQVRVFLMDQTQLSAIGNAYADEILFDARLHPKTFCNQLTPEEIERLYASIKHVLARGIEEVERAQQPIEIKVRDHMKVRNRRDQPCPRCGATIRRAGVLGHDSFFCPQCQPPVRKQFIEWS